MLNETDLQNHKPVRTILYVSEAHSDQPSEKLTYELAHLFGEARKNNRQHDISGCLIFSGKLFVHVIEGEPNRAMQLLKNIYYDNRHQHLRVLLDIRSQARRFQSWESKLSPTRLESSDLIHLLRSRFGWRFDENPLATELVQKFQNMISLDNSGSSFSLAKFSLHHWPRFDQVKPERNLLEFCAHLSGGCRTYRNLIAHHSFGGQQNVDDLLCQLEKLGVLQIEPYPEQYQNLTADKPGLKATFFKKMSAFLRKFHQN